MVVAVDIVVVAVHIVVVAVHIVVAAAGIVVVDIVFAEFVVVDIVVVAADIVVVDKVVQQPVDEHELLATEIPSPSFGLRLVTSSCYQEELVPIHRTINEINIKISFNFNIKIKLNY